MLSSTSGWPTIQLIGFVCHMMEAMGFSNWWVSRISECISTTTFSILIKGQPFDFIHNSRGLCQGDLLSSYLFTIVMEHCTCLMDAAVHSWKIDPVSRFVSSHVSHLIYVDDLLVFLRPSSRSILHLLKILDEFGRMSSMQINKDKCHAFFNKTCSAKDTWKQLLQMDEGTLPVRYLGTPLHISYAKFSNCTGLLQSIQYRLEGWKAQLLSSGGRIELVRVMINAIIMLWFQTILLPMKCIRKIEKLCANFVWRGRMHSIAWSVLCRLKDEGGVGLRSLSTLREIATLKLTWRY